MSPKINKMWLKEENIKNSHEFHRKDKKLPH